MRLKDKVTIVTGEAPASNEGFAWPTDTGASLRRYANRLVEGVSETVAQNS